MEESKTAEKAEDSPVKKSPGKNDDTAKDSPSLEDSVTIVKDEKAKPDVKDDHISKDKADEKKGASSDAKDTKDAKASPKPSPK